MNLDETQKRTVAQWIAEGLKLSDIQKRIASELGVTLTYMDVRLLVDDLKLTPKDTEPPKPAGDLGGAKPAGASQSMAAGSPAPSIPAAGSGSPATRPGGVSVSVDSIARPGAVVSGQVTFTDGQSADWYLDEMGRLGLLPQQQGYRPSPGDLRTFQTELQNHLAKMGF